MDTRNDLAAPLYSPGASISATVFSPNHPPKKVEVHTDHQETDSGGSCLQAIIARSTASSGDSEVMLVIRSSVWINFVLMICKLYTFLISGSLAVLASLVDSIIDLLGQGALMFTSSLAQKGRGEHEEYPVGRGRLEPVGVMICAVVMGMASMEVISQSTLRLVKYWDRSDAPEVALTLTAALLLVGVIFLKVGLYQWCKAVYQRNPQEAVKAIAQDNLNDVISNIAALWAPEMILLGHQFWIVDPLAGIGISIYIIYTWLVTGFEQVEMIVGKRADPDFLQKVYNIVEGHDTRMQLDSLNAYHFGPKYLVELEVVMPEAFVPLPLVAMARVHLENQRPLESDDDDTSDEEREMVDEMEMEHAQLSKAPVFTAVMAESLQPDGSDSHEGGALNERPDAREGTKKTTKSKARRCTPEVKALSVSAFLFSFITVVQIFAAHIAHSQALLMDCISMGVDAFTYLGNIVVECRKRDGETHAKSQLVIVATSLGLLCYFTADAMKESWGTIQVCLGRADAKDEDDVNGWITLGFALGGVGFDLMCLLEFYKSNKKTGSVKSVNMFSALLHVSADFLRSTSTLIMSLLILLCKVDSTCIDAYTSVFIGITIISGAFVGFFKWIKLLITFCCKERPEKA